MSYNLSRNIKVLLTIHNLKQPEFGKLIGNSSGAAVSSWIQGVSAPPLDKLILMCNHFDLSLDQLVFGEVGKPNPAYDDFMRKNHPDLVMEGESTYKLKPGDVVLNDDVLTDPDKMGRLVRWLTEKHTQLSEDALFELYRERVVLEAENNKRREMIRDQLLNKKDSPSNP